MLAEVYKVLEYNMLQTARVGWVQFPCTPHQILLESEEGFPNASATFKYVMSSHTSLLSDPTGTGGCKVALSERNVKINTVVWKANRQVSARS